MKKNNEPILKILIGVSGSGKTTWAANHIKNDLDYFIDIEYFSRDQLRINYLKNFGLKPTLKTYYKLNQRVIQSLEKRFTLKGEACIKNFHQECHKSIFTYNLFIFDTTMLKPEYLERVLKVADDNYDVRLVIFSLPNKWLLKWRLFWRDGITDFRYLDKQIEDYYKMIQYIEVNHSDKLIQKI